MMKFLSILILLGLSVGISLQYTKPTLARAEATRQKVQQLEEALQQARHIRTVRDRLMSKYNELSDENLDRLKKMIPDHVDNIKLVLDMDGIAAQFGLRLANVQIQNAQSSQSSTAATGAPGEARLRLNTKTNEAKKSLSIGFTVEAEYEKFLAFLKDLERSLRIVDVEKLSIAPTNLNTTGGEFAGDGQRGGQAQQGPVVPRYTFSLVLRTYWLNKENDGGN